MSPRLLDLPPEAWPERFVALGGRPFHGRSAARRVLREGRLDWQDLLELPRPLRESLVQEEPLATACREQVARAPDGSCKLLLRFPDGAATEAVSMPGTRGRTLCVSTQVGCPIRCAFCASGLDGLERNLAAGEILEQVLHLQDEAGPWRRLVVMGMGEPGCNLEATLAALDTLLSPAGGDLSARRVTLSTVAPPGTLARLAAWGRPVTVALSLHAPEDELRRRLIPGAARHRLADILAEADALFARTGREFTVEYTLLAEVNDGPGHALALAALLRGRRCHANLIPYNPVSGLPFRRPPRERCLAFAALLRRQGIPTTLRRSLGGPVEAACGQLRRRADPPPAPTP